MQVLKTNIGYQMMLYINSVGFVFKRPFRNSYNAAGEQLNSGRINEIEECPGLQNF